MKRAKTVATACFTLLIGILALMNARAQDFIGLEKSILTFSAPVELPNLTLQPGTYMFKRPDPNSARIIQVFTEDGMKILGTFLTVPTKRLEVSGENVVTFKESREGATPAVHYWYYPGVETGHEFVYPKSQAITIARRTGETVLSSEGEVTAESKVTPVRPEETNASASSSEVQESTPKAESQVASNVEPKNAPDRYGQTVGTSGSNEPNAAAKSELPRTASPLPLTSLIGLFSLGGAATLRRLRRQ